MADLRNRVITGTSVVSAFPVGQADSEPKPNILPLLVLQQRSLFKTLSDGFEKLQGFVDDSNCSEEQRLEKVSIALEKLNKNVTVSRCRMDALVRVATEAGRDSLAGIKEPELEEVVISPLMPPYRRVQGTSANVPRNFSRPFPPVGNPIVHHRDCNYESSASATPAPSGGNMSPKAPSSVYSRALSSVENATETPRTPPTRELQQSRHSEHNETPTMPAQPSPSSPKPPLTQAEGRALVTPPGVSIMINTPLDSSGLRKQFQHASTARDPYHNEVRKISVLQTGQIRTAYYQTEPTDAEILALAADEPFLFSEDSGTQSMDRMARLRRKGRMIRHGMRILSCKGVGKSRRR
ncbi:hypothetical protein L873DRAFT_1792560 [Choiromyces venosus 120613-1]|uniref:Uncharacterized protein n=1 Tax=Choiromyces venosus 120613-1 TaxID=1336337 RepID=A0A3N4JCC5_9PEZI|nr:hypothetical protein L873DRAFT_1792560 [Choiromyces venosus 120613-1]